MKKQEGCYDRKYSQIAGAVLVKEMEQTKYGQARPGVHAWGDPEMDPGG